MEDINKTKEIENNKEKNLLKVKNKMNKLIEKWTSNHLSAGVWIQQVMVRDKTGNVS